jgi:ABC-type transport system involved in cytochrome bd biosynthesis fused ATPase/permease subunit
MALLTKFDRVIYMADGRVIDAGTVDEITERQPLFRALLRQHDADTRGREVQAG